MAYDLPLNEEERVSVWELGQNLSRFRLGRIFSSRSIRALHTSQILAQGQPDACVLFSHRESEYSDWYQPNLAASLSRCLWIYPEAALTLERNSEQELLKKDSLHLLEKDILPSIEGEEGTLLVAEPFVLQILHERLLGETDACHGWDLPVLSCYSYAREDSGWSWKGSLVSSTLTPKEG
ncbi:hypothetical protein HAT2_00763 [Candidatus Similichlamydia laticola]|uniref:Uncharacterized protein n=2 Tax=Candidatus Similichlamydia laticola TaxID=2170265 RepID=A0A369KEM6_9BACT|nr:hypothetical protein HAT2_00763 [Candidatus Similichlamydia laticola]